MHKSTAAACDVLVFLADGSWPFFTPDHTAKCTYGCRKKKTTSLFILSLLGTVNTSLLARLRDLASCK